MYATYVNGLVLLKTQKKETAEQILIGVKLFPQDSQGSLKGWQAMSKQYGVIRYRGESIHKDGQFGLYTFEVFGYPDSACSLRGAMYLIDMYKVGILPS